MIFGAARMRRWILWGAPVVLAAGWGLRAGGAAAGLMLWLVAGAAFPARGRYPYPRKRGGRPWRLLFAFSLGALALGGLGAAARLCYTLFSPATPLYDALALSGAVFFALPLCAFGMAVPLPLAYQRRLGPLFCAAALLLIACR